MVVRGDVDDAAAAVESLLAASGLKICAQAKCRVSTVRHPAFGDIQYPMYQAPKKTSASS
ncbi:hypothetical protein ACFOWZ_22530 [Lentzea rhizosphaerae]|uniref:BMC domain-containing protein n=1 Tax=Lentzea rhizosphaerae TaxID=2041025 RepID=A0ABV8BVU9_9PSEU